MSAKYLKKRKCSQIALQMQSCPKTSKEQTGMVIKCSSPRPLVHCTWDLDRAFSIMYWIKQMPTGAHTSISGYHRWHECWSHHHIWSWDLWKGKAVLTFSVSILSFHRPHILSTSQNSGINWNTQELGYHLFLDTTNIFEAHHFCQSINCVPWSLLSRNFWSSKILKTWPWVSLLNSNSSAKSEGRNWLDINPGEEVKCWEVITDEGNGVCKGTAKQCVFARMRHVWWCCRMEDMQKVVEDWR